MYNINEVITQTDIDLLNKLLSEENKVSRWLSEAWKGGRVRHM